jgi:predicted dehydrogenase
MVNIGVVGCGYWGPKHIRVFHELSSAKLTAVCDLDEDKILQVQARYPGVKTGSCFEDFLNSVDGVVIATPVNTHYKLAKEALLHNKHVLIEKPMTVTSREGLELIELAEKRDMALMVGHLYEYHPAFEYLKTLVSDGHLGDIYGIDSERLNLGLYRTDVNVLWDLAPHDLSIILKLMDKDPIAVSARGTRHINPEIYDVGYIEIFFENDTMCHVHVSWLHPRKIRQTTVIGSKKMAIYNDVSESEKISIFDIGLSITGNGRNGNGDSKFTAWPPNYRYGDQTIPFISSAEPLKNECNHFVKCIADGTKPKSDGWAGLKVTVILEAAELSMANGGRRESLDLAAMAIDLNSGSNSF